MFWVIEKSEENFAWGHQQSGTVVTSNGDVYKYQTFGNDKLEHISDKIKPQYKQQAIVDRSDINMLNTMLNETELDNISLTEPVNKMFDRGTNIYNVYFNDKKYTIYQYGDWTREPTTDYGNELLRKILSIIQRI